MSLLLDASVWLAAVDVDDPFHPPSRELCLGSAGDTTAIDLTLYEVGNVAVRQWRDPGRARNLCAAILTEVGDRLVRLDAGLVSSAIDIAGREGITVYDAAYVAAARAGSHQLVSCDLNDLVGPGFAVAPGAMTGKA